MRIFLGRRVPPVKSLRLALAVAGLLLLAAFTALTAQPQDRSAPTPAIPATIPGHRVFREINP